jgi:SAM-dependent methyltransferase
MFYETLDHLRCPNASGSCGGRLQPVEPVIYFRDDDTQDKPGHTQDIEWGFLECDVDGERFPILGGVAILVEHIADYIRMHARGIRGTLDQSRTPEEFAPILANCDEAPLAYQDWALESEEVNSLYLASHYLDGSQVAALGSFHPAFEDLIRSHWDGPAQYLHRVFSQWTRPLSTLLDMGCGVGGALMRARQFSRFSLGIDQCFRSIFTARSLNCRSAAEQLVDFRPDLLAPTQRLRVDMQPHPSGNLVDFVVGDILHPPVAMNHWDTTLSLNVLDVLPEPEKLPQVQENILRSGGTVIHSCPYQWSLDLLPDLRSKLPSQTCTSAQATEWLYRQCGFQVRESLQHLPWLFFEHERRLDLYSAHMMIADL